VASRSAVIMVYLGGGVTLRLKLMH
jgi:hypothetical protein